MWYRAWGVLLLLLLAVPTGAQTLGPTEMISIGLNPQYPRPNELVTVRVNSTAIDLISSTVVISVNGTEVDRGTGVITTQVRIGPAGQTTTIAVAVTNNGETYRRTLTVRPADVALVVEPLTTSHPFYKGGSLVASDGPLRITAIPDIRTSGGARVAAQNLVYTWRLGNQVLQQYSGIGRSTLTATAPVRYRSANVSVTVTTQDQSVVAQAQTLVAPTDPFLRIYRNDPLLGPLYDRALSGEVAMADQEETLRAVPYFFSATTGFSWLLNSVETSTVRDITVRTTEGRAGSALLTAVAKGPGIFQSAETALTVRFGDTNLLGIFGL